MFEKLSLDYFAQKLQNSEYNKSKKVDALIPHYIDGMLNCLNEHITQYTTSPNENTFQKLTAGNDALCAELDSESKKNKTWTSFFAIGVLAYRRQQQVAEDSSEMAHLRLIIEGLQQIWGEGFILKGLPPKLNEVAVNKVLTGIDKWVEARELSKPNPEIYSKEVITMRMLVNILESALEENKSSVASYLPSAFSTLTNIKNTLSLKNPELSMTLIIKDNELLKEFLSKQPEKAQTIFNGNKALVHELVCIRPIPDCFREFLEMKPELAIELLKKDQSIELERFIVPILLLKAPRYIDSIISNVYDSLNRVLTKDGMVLDALLKEQPVLALKLFSENNSLVKEWLPHRRAPESFRKLLENNPQFALELLKSDQTDELKEFIVSTALAKTPEHIGSLITIAPGLVNTILKSDRTLLHATLSWLDSAAGKQLDPRDANAIEVFMAPFKIKSTADILFSLQTKRDASTFIEALDSTERSYKKSIKYLELVARKERLNAFSIERFAGKTTSLFDPLAFWNQYPNRAAIEALCDDLDLASDSPQRGHLLSHVNVSLENVDWSWSGGRALISAGLSYLNTWLNPEFTGGVPSLEFIITSEVIQLAKTKAEKQVETTLSGYSVLDTELAYVKGIINTLDSSLKEFTIEDWISKHSNFDQLISDDSKMWNAILYMEEIQKSLDKYKQELNKLIYLAKSIEKLDELGVDVRDLSKSLEQYIEALYQQEQAQIYGVKYKEHSAKGAQDKIKFMMDKIDENKATIKASMINLSDLWYKEKASDEELIDLVQNFTSNAKGWWHEFLKWISPTYKQLSNTLSKQISDYHTALESRSVNDHDFAEELRCTLKSQRSYFVAIKVDIKPKHAETDVVSEPAEVDDVEEDQTIKLN